MQHELRGRMKMVKTLAVSREMRLAPKLAVRARKAIGDQQMKSVNTNKAIRLAILWKKNTLVVSESEDALLI